MFTVTLSFLLTTPGALMPTNPFQQFLLKDIVLLGAALLTAAEAVSAGRLNRQGCVRCRAVSLSPPKFEKRVERHAVGQVL